MGKSLGHRVIAEGVETGEQLAFLQAQRCGEGQGYYFSRPLIAEQFVRLLETGGRERFSSSRPIERASSPMLQREAATLAFFSEHVPHKSAVQCIVDRTMASHATGTAGTADRRGPTLRRLAVF